MCACFRPNREEAPSQPSPSSHWAIASDGCDDGDGHGLLLWSEHAHMPQAKRVLPGHHAMRGARAQHFATVRPENKVCRVCGSHLAKGATGKIPHRRWRVRDWSDYGRCEPECVPGSQVCTPAARKTAWDENSMLVRVCWWFYVERCEIGHRGCPGFGAPSDKGVS